MADSSGGLLIELLGPVEAWVDGRAVALGGQRPRALFAVLALMGGRVVTIDRLIDELWGEDPPVRARDSVQVHVSRLRKGLAEAGADGGRLVSQAGGYVLDVRPGERDVDRWQQALGRARRARAGGESRVAREVLEEALGVWRGQPLGGVSANSLISAERARLEEERLAAVIEGIELDLELGRHGELLGQLEALVVAHPFQERLVELQMLALYRCGRQADALTAFHSARARFVDELGIEPGPSLRELHDDVLKHAPGLTPVERVRDGPPQAAVVAPSARGLPVSPNRTIGREDDLHAIGERLHAGSVRLLTLTGPGGVGKTRLGLEAARGVEQDFADGAYFVSLAAVQRPDDVLAAIVSAMGVIQLARESPSEAAERFLRAKHVLLVVDNFEHVLDATPFLGALLEACASLTILATSREPLALRAEVRYPVPPLALPEIGTPDDPEALGRAAAVELFCERAQAHDPDFDLLEAGPSVVTEICRHLDGLPLAIELAAARCGVLSAGEIAQRLEGTLDALGVGARDASSRQQTLRATIDWSFNLLGDAEQECFTRLAVFAGGATVEAAETVTRADLDTLHQLVDKSLLVRRHEAGAPTRLRMLETIRAYASERFAGDVNADAVREDHYRYYLALAERHGSQRALYGTFAREHLAPLDAEVDNLHAALGWAVSQSNAELGLALEAALGWYWITRDHYVDAVDWADEVVDIPGADAHPALCIRVLRTKGLGLRLLGRASEHVLEEAEAIARELGDPAILSQALQDRVDHEAPLRPNLAARLAAEALTLAQASGDEWLIATAFRARAKTATTIEQLRDWVDRAASRLTEAGNMFELASLLGGAGYWALWEGWDRDAKNFTESALPIARQLDQPFIWMFVRGNFGLAALLTGDRDAARHAFRDELRLCGELVARPYACEGLHGLAGVAVVDDNLDRAARLVGAGDALRCEPASPVDGRLHAAFFEPARARCGARVWDAAARDGGTFSFEDAIAYALQEPLAALPQGSSEAPQRPHG